MEQLTIFVVAGILTEGVTEVIKQLKKDGKLNTTMLISILIGEGVAFATQLDILQALGFDVAIPFFGVVITGLLISRGSNYIADLVTKLTNPTQNIEINNNKVEKTIKDVDEDVKTLLEELEDSIN